MISSLREARPISYNPIQGNLYCIEPADAEFIGFIAEELIEIDPRLVEFDKEGPSSVHYERIGQVLTNLVKRQRDRIARVGSTKCASSSQDLMLISKTPLNK